jgi:hypothetical protein
VRNVWLPTAYRHGSVPDTRHLAHDPAIRDWIERYRPTEGFVVRPRVETAFDGDSRHIVWAAEVWYSIKKHWVLELQRLIRAQRARPA